MVKRRHPVIWAWLCLGLTGCALFGEDVQPPCPRAVTIADAQLIAQLIVGRIPSLPPP